MSKGYVYILTNPSMPGLVKIGMTSRDVHQRAEELFASGVPEAFSVYFSILSPDCADLERSVHQRFEKSRHNASREFFSVDPKAAERVLIEFQAEQLREFVGEYTEFHQLVDDYCALDPADVLMLADKTGRHPLEVVNALGCIHADELEPALSRCDDIVERKRSHKEKIQ